VDGLGRRHSRTYDIEDTGRLVEGREIDIFMADCRAARNSAINRPAFECCGSATASGRRYLNGVADRPKAELTW
jgi:hypothetical protein